MTTPDRCFRCGQRADDWPDGEGGMLCQTCWDAMWDELAQKLPNMKTEKSERKKAHSDDDGIW